MIDRYEDVRAKLVDKTLQRAREVADPQHLKHFDLDNIRLMFGR